MQAGTRVIRARPLLGTRVDIRLEHLGEAAANAAIDAGFAAVAEIHRLMSFHEPGSDVSRLNRDAAAMPVAVDPQTYEVLRRCREISEASGGLFDITTAGQLVAWGFLPPPASARAPDPGASWRDVVLDADSKVRFARPLWIDLGGIAKGYAVDRALAAMALAPGVQACINAGGDLRVAGPAAESIRLRLPSAFLPLQGYDVPMVEIESGSLASSSGREHLRTFDGAQVGPHVDGGSGHSVGTATFVSVAAADCIVADALTKVVMAAGRKAEPVLRRYNAVAYSYQPESGWLILGENKIFEENMGE